MRHPIIGIKGSKPRVSASFRRVSAKKKAPAPKTKSTSYLTESERKKRKGWRAQERRRGLKLRNCAAQSAPIECRTRSAQAFFGCAVILRASLTVRFSAARAQERHSESPRRKSSSGNSFPQASHCLKPSIANGISSKRLASGQALLRLWGPCRAFPRVARQMPLAVPGKAAWREIRRKFAGVCGAPETRRKTRSRSGSGFLSRQSPLVGFLTLPSKRF